MRSRIRDRQRNFVLDGKMAKGRPGELPFGRERLAESAVTEVEIPVIIAYFSTLTTASKNAQSFTTSPSLGVERALHTTITTCAVGFT